MTLIQELALYGAITTREGDNIKLTGLDTVPAMYIPRVRALIAEAKARKGEILSLMHLQEQGFTVQKHHDGVEYEVVCNATDMISLRKWKQAMDEGRIVLNGKVQILARSNIVRFRYRCAAPTEWLQAEMQKGS